MDPSADPAEPKMSKQYAALRSDLSAALSAFDRAQDWADLIHDLQRVNRVFTKHSTTSYLPEKHLLAKRLAQCLTSSLPSGVHLKALETYRLVFTRIGPQRLALDLPYYAGGLFPLLSYSATSLKPALLGLYESQLLPLGPALAPLLDGLVLAVLPGLEDESSEFYERCVALLDSVGAVVGNPPLFCRSLWRALLLSPPMRLPAASYIRARLTADRKLPWTRNMLDDMPLVSHAIAAALNDRNALVQRSVLDLLLGELALDLPFFARAGEDCRAAAVALVSGVFGALLRRDLSLTKRVHSWFLGGKEGDRGVRFCAKYSRRWLLDAIDDEMIHAMESAKKESGTASLVTRPCKIAMGLIDRVEINSCIAAPVSLKVLQFGRDMLQSPTAPFRRDVQHAVTDVIESLGSAVVFGELERYVGEASFTRGGMPAHAEDSEGSERGKYDLLSFALLIVPMEDSTLRCRQLPALLRVAVQALNRISAMPKLLKPAVAFCEAALSAMNVSSMQSVDSAQVRPVMEEIGSTFTSFFVAWIATTVPSAPSEMRRAYSDIDVDKEIIAEFETSAMLGEKDECVAVAKAACSFLAALVRSGVCGPTSAHVAMQAAAKCASSGDVRVALPGARAYAEIAANVASDEWKESMQQQTLGVIRQAWRLLHPSLATATASSAQVWLLLQRQFPDFVNIVVADGILSPVGSRRLRNLERFACLWRLSVEHRLCPCPADPGLFLMLDALDDREWGPKMLARSWLSDALVSDAGAVLDAPLRLLLTPKANSRGQNHEFAGVYDAPRALYAFQVLRSIVEGAMLGTRGVTGDTVSDGDEDEVPGSGLLTEASEWQGEHTRRSRNLPAGARSLSSTSPTPRTVAALSGFLGLTNEFSRGADEDSAADEGAVKLTGLLPALDYVTVLTLTALGYLRGRVPKLYEAIERHPLRVVVNGGSSSPRVVGVAVGTANGSTELDDDMEWISAGLGFKSFSELHAAVAVAAAEFLAKLMSSIPSGTPSSDRLAERSADALLNLFSRSITDRDAVLQMHYLEAIEAVVVFEGHMFPGARLSCRRIAAGVQLSAQPLQHPTSAYGMSNSGQKAMRRRRSGYMESNPMFLPWILVGLAQACKAPADGRDIGSQEILALRRRWIRFVSTVLKHVNSSFPNFVEGVSLTLCRLLEDRQLSVDDTKSAWMAVSESEFSRIDERLLLLRGLSSVCGTVSILFECARRNSDLHDDSEPPLKQNGQANPDGLDRTRGIGGPEGSLQRPSGDRTFERENSLASGKFTSGPSSGSSMPLVRRSIDRHGELGSSTPHESTSNAQASTSLGAPSAAAAATMTMMNAINNPLRMLNDFVKDVFTGAAPEGMAVRLDPRRAAARFLFMHMPLIVGAVLQTWGPQLDPVAPAGEIDASHRGRRSRSRFLSEPAMPRLSRELPREKRRTQRLSVMSVVEPLFLIRPTDVVAGIVSKFVGGEPEENSSRAQICFSAVDMIRCIELATPEVVISCIGEVLNLAMKWDAGSAQAQEGRLQMERKLAACSAVSVIVEKGSENGMAELGVICDVALRGMNGSPLPGSGSGENESSVALSSSGVNTGVRSSSAKLFHPADYFANHSPGEVETAAVLFLQKYVEACRDKDGLNHAWPALHGIARDVYGGHTRKSTMPHLCLALAAFANHFPAPFPDRRARKELMSLSSSVITLCSAMASGTHDLSSEVSQGEQMKDIRARYSLQALQSLSRSIAVLLDSAFIDDRAQLGNCAGIAFASAMAVLKRTAAKAAAARAASLSDPKFSYQSKFAQQNDVDVDTLSSSAAAELVLQVSRHEWGVKLARRELVGLLDDPNFFYGKHSGVLSRLADVVREVMVSGGSAALLSSIGTGTPVSATGIPGLFTGRDPESVLRARAVRRVAFCVFVAEPDSYLPQLPGVLERLRDSLRLADPGLVVECMLCLRVLLLRTGPSSIAAFRATTLSEMFRVASDPTRNLPETLAVLQFLDLITLISPPDFGYVRCFFFANERSSQADETTASSGVDRTYKPLIPKLALLRSNDGQLEDAKLPSSSLRVAAGQTVFSGQLDFPLTEQFIGKYAEFLALRNQQPGLATAVPDFDAIRKELETEFVQ